MDRKSRKNSVDCSKKGSKAGKQRRCFDTLFALEKDTAGGNIARNCKGPLLIYCFQVPSSRESKYKRSDIQFTKGAQTNSQLIAMEVTCT